MLYLKPNSELEESIWAVMKRGRMICYGITYFEADELVKRLGGDDYEITTDAAVRRTFELNENR